MKKLTYLLLIALLFTTASCKQGSSMNTLNPLLAQIKDSTTVEQEHNSLEEVGKFIGDNRVSIEVNTFNDDVKQNLQEVQDLTDVQKVEIIFFFEDKEKRFIWTPKDINNVFVLFRE